MNKATEQLLDTILQPPVKSTSIILGEPVPEEVDQVDALDELANTIDIVEQFGYAPSNHFTGEHPNIGSMKIKKLEHYGNLPMPKYQSKLASGFDLIAAIDDPIHLNSIGATVMIPTGISVEVPVGFEAQIRPRSGLAAKHGITVTNTPGTIDADYRGEIKVLLTNLAGRRFRVERGMRIAQMIISPVVQVELVEAETLGDTERGDSGFGSTGVK